MASAQDRLNKPAEVFFTFPIASYKKLANGDIEVYGPCTDGSVDEDHQRVDPKWSGKALQDWYDKGANIRVQHSPFLYPAGRGTALEVGKERTRDGQQHWIKALVAHETPAAGLVEKKILKDFSIGILDPVITYGDPTAPGGTICGGRIGEVSLVDRGSNKNSSFTIVKSVGGTPQLVCKMRGEPMTTTAPSPIELRRSAYRRQFVTPTKRKQKDGTIVDSGGRDVSDLPAEDFAGPDGTYPIKTRDDVSDAASLAHHAADPEAVESKIRSIASRKFNMEGDDLPESLRTGKAAPPRKESWPDEDGSGKVENDEKPFPQAAKPFKKRKKANKSDAGEDGAEASGDGGETVAEYDADIDSDDDGDQPGKKVKKNASDKAFQKAILKYQRAELAKSAQRGNNGGNTPSETTGHADPDAAESGFSSAKDKKMVPAGKHREPDGPGAEDFEEDAGMHSDDETGDEDGIPGSDWSANKSAPSYGMRRLHDAICPAYRWGLVRKSYGLSRDVGATIPVREIETLAMDAIAKGSMNEADYFTSMLRTAASIQEVGPDVLLDARKALPAMFPTAHPHQQTDVRPTQFTRGYLSAGHPSLSAPGASGGSSLPRAAVHEISAQDFHRGFISPGHASPSPAEGTQASSSTAAFGQALNSLSEMHQRVAMLWPDMCPVSVEQRDYTTQEGSTGIRPTKKPSVPAAPGESANKTAVPKVEKRLRKQLAKAVAANKSLKDEVDLLGSLPDPEQAPYRGLPVLDGPVDRDSFVGKAIGGADDEDGEDAEFLTYMNGLASTGDPRLRLAATKAIRTILTK